MEASHHSAMQVDDPQEESNDDTVSLGVGAMAGCWMRLRSLPGSVGCWVAGFAKKLVNVAMEDPRRVAHSVKVGLALALVSLVYYVQALFKGLGDSTMWAVLTVVVVMEYTVGGTLSKGLNRAFATLVAACIAVGVHKLAELAEHCCAQGEPILLTVFVFFLASAATFSRFIPEIKAKYDYGVTIFILTFSLVAVSSYRVEELIQLAQQRFYTIVVGVAICLGITIFLFPIWAGEDLHRLAAGNLDKLAEFLEGMKSECFGKNNVRGDFEGKEFLQVYKSVINSKATEDSLCTFAKWELRHGKFRFRHPWSQYQKLGALCRQCASSMEALSSSVLTTTKTQDPALNSELCLKVRTTCGEMISESAKVLRELSTAIRITTVPSPADIAMSSAKKAAERFRSELSEDATLLQVIHVVVSASLLSDMVTQVKEIAESVDNIARLARFRKPQEGEKDVVIDIVSRRGCEPMSDGIMPCGE